MNTSLDTRNAKPKAKRPEPTPRNVQAEGVRPTVEVEGGVRILSFFFTIVEGPRRSLSLKLSDARVDGP